MKNEQKLIKTKKNAELCSLKQKIKKNHPTNDENEKKNVQTPTLYNTIIERKIAKIKICTLYK